MSSSIQTKQAQVSNAKYKHIKIIGYHVVPENFLKAFFYIYDHGSQLGYVFDWPSHLREKSVQTAAINKYADIHMGSFFL